MIDPKLLELVLTCRVEVSGTLLVVPNVLGVLILVDPRPDAVDVLRSMGACVKTGFPLGPRVHEEA